MTSSRGTIVGIQMIVFGLSRRACSTRRAISSPIAGVSGAPAQNTICTPGRRSLMALSRCTMPFCRVMRPTNSTKGSVGVDVVGLQHGRIRRRLVLLHVDAVMNDANLLKRHIVERVHIASHRFGDGDRRHRRSGRRCARPRSWRDRRCRVVRPSRDGAAPASGW